MKRMILTAVLLAALAAPAAAFEVGATARIDAGGDGPFGAAFTPDGSTLLVSHFGGVMNNECSQRVWTSLVTGRDGKGNALFIEMGKRRCSAEYLLQLVAGSHRRRGGGASGMLVDVVQESRDVVRPANEVGKVNRMGG